MAQKSLLRRRCGKDFQFGATLLLCVFATGCDKTDWQLRAEKRYRCGDAPAMQSCSWRLLNAMCWMCEGKNWCAEVQEEVGGKHFRAEVA